MKSLREAYELFGADESTPFRTIKKAYYALARRHHPDKNGDQEYFKVINNAFHLIEEHERRRSLKPQCAKGGKENRPSEAWSDTASQRESGGKRKNRDESTSRTTDERKNKKAKASTSREGSTEPSEEDLRNIRRRAEERVAEEKRREAARQDEYEAFLFKVPGQIKAYLERFKYGPYSPYARLPDPRLEGAYQEYCNGTREPAQIEYEDNLLRMPNRIFGYLQQIRSNSPMFPRHQPDWRLFEVYSGYTNISLQSEEQRLYEASLLKTPAKIKKYLEQANSDNPKFPRVMPNPQLYVAYDNWCAEMDAKKRQFVVKLQNKNKHTALIKIQSFWRTVPKPQLRLAQIEAHETQLVVGGTANNFENSMGSGSSAIPPLGGEADKESTALGGEADKEPLALGGEADNDLRNSNQGSDLVGGGTGKDLQEPPLGGEADIAQSEVQETQLVVGGTRLMT